MQEGSEWWSTGRDYVGKDKAAYEQHMKWSDINFGPKKLEFQLI